MTISKEVQRLSQDALVTLYVLDTSPIGGSAVYRFTSMPNGDSPVLFDGEEYTPTDIAATGFTWDGRGQFPRPKLQITNVNDLVSSAVFGFGDLVGARFYRIRTYARHLDTGSDPDPTATFPIEIYTVDQLTKLNRVYAEWQLASLVEQLGVMLPRRQCLRDNCTHTYRIYRPETDDFDYSTASCPYTGGTYYDQNGNVVASKAEDKCGRRVKDCKLRFGANAELPTRAFPGISRNNRLV